MPTCFEAARHQEHGRYHRDGRRCHPRPERRSPTPWVATATAIDLCCRGLQLNERGSAAATLDCRLPVHQHPQPSVSRNTVSPPRPSRPRCPLLPTRPAAGTAGRPEFCAPAASQGPTPASLAVTASELVSCLCTAPLRTREALPASFGRRRLPSRLAASGAWPAAVARLSALLQCRRRRHRLSPSRWPPGRRRRLSLSRRSPGRRRQLAPSRGSPGRRRRGSAAVRSSLPIVRRTRGISRIRRYCRPSPDLRRY